LTKSFSRNYNTIGPVSQVSFWDKSFIRESEMFETLGFQLGHPLGIFPENFPKERGLLFLKKTGLREFLSPLFRKLSFLFRELSSFKELY